MIGQGLPLSGSTRRSDKPVPIRHPAIRAAVGHRTDMRKPPGVNHVAETEPVCHVVQRREDGGSSGIANLRNTTAPGHNSFPPRPGLAPGREEIQRHLPSLASWK